eukprot:scaffold936_cov173-Ochromonas_danica.AAC.1
MALADRHRSSHRQSVNSVFSLQSSVFSLQSSVFTMEGKHFVPTHTAARLTESGPLTPLCQVSVSYRIVFDPIRYRYWYRSAAPKTDTTRKDALERISHEVFSREELDFVSK